MILTLTEWKKITDHSTSGDMVPDIMMSWKKDQDYLKSEVARLNARVAELEARDDSDKRYARGKCGLHITEEEADVILLNWITDGFGSYWLKFCPNCGAPMQVVRPGFARCSKECYIKPEG